MATGRIGTTPVLTTRWSKAPAAGTTSLSGLDDNSVSLVYSVGYEAVYQNGVLLSRGNDYTATNGTTITLTTATVAGDIIEVFANQTIPLTDTYTQTVANGKFINNTLTTTTGDIIYASAANTPARLGIGSTGQVLTVSGGVPAWGAASGGLTLITNQAFTTVSSYSLPANTFSATYNNYEIILDVTAFSANNTLGARLRSGSTDYTDGQYLYQELSASGGSASANSAATSNTSIQVGDVNSATNYQMKMTLFKPNVTIKKWYFVDSIQYTSAGVWKYIKGSGRIDTASAYDSMSFIPSSGTMTGRVYVYGYNI
jgi:hypothetical protein